MDTPQVTILTQNEIQAKLTALEGLVASLPKLTEKEIITFKNSVLISYCGFEHGEAEALAALLKHRQGLR